MLDGAVLSGRIHALKDQQQRARVLRVEQFEALFEVQDAPLELLLCGIFVSKWGGVAGTMTGKRGAVARSDSVLVDVHRGLVSCTRAPLRMPSTLRALPSWQAYSYIGPSLRVNGTEAVHVRVQMVGSSIVKR